MWICRVCFEGRCGLCVRTVAVSLLRVCWYWYLFWYWLRVGDQFYGPDCVDLVGLLVVFVVLVCPVSVSASVSASFQYHSVYLYQFVSVSCLISVGNRWFV